MADTHTETGGDVRKRQLSRLIITRTRPVHGEIPEENIAERAVDEQKRGPARVEQGDTGDVDQPS